MRCTHLDLIQVGVVKVEPLFGRCRGDIVEARLVMRGRALFVLRMSFDISVNVFLLVNVSRHGSGTGVERGMGMGGG